ncbi:MAG: hypothetical protein MJE66_22760 [Proteobacteria bacterium]|nr:hypothetical protein [Pseudomonadota bacterium]
MAWYMSSNMDSTKRHRCGISSAEATAVVHALAASFPDAPRRSSDESESVPTPRVFDAQDLR